MTIPIPAACPRRPSAGLPAMAGFSLLEMLVVLVITGILVALVGITYRSDGQQSFAEQAERLALLFEEASDQARLSDEPLRWMADARGYRFQRRDAGLWQNIDRGLLRPRLWHPEGVRLLAELDAPERPGQLYFPTEMPALPATLTLAFGPRQLRVVTDGTGVFHVLQR